RFPDLTYKDYEITVANSFQYGPICIHEEYRGTGLINYLFEEMRLSFAKKYPLSITFINQGNPRSVKAHVNKLGWEIIDEFNFNDKLYYGLAFEMSKSVLPK
ncbi:MAG: GNAT family acetyltransferase, partial [Bacteroidota bacterium]